MFIKCGVIVILLTLNSAFCDDQGELYRWNVISYYNAPRMDTYKIQGQNYYIPENNIPTGVTPYKDKVFITVARSNPGIPSTLNYVEYRIGRNDKSPQLHAFPNYTMNELYAQPTADKRRIISVYRTRVDECHRLWFVDTGVVESGTGTPVIIQPPSIWAIDLRNNKIVIRFDIPVGLYKNEPTGFTSINVDTDWRHCSEAYAYMPNSKANVLIVYSLSENKIWAFADPTMNPETSTAITRFPINGVTYTLNYGIYSVALGYQSWNRLRKVYYHPLASFNEFYVSNTILKNSAFSGTIASSTEFKYQGNRGGRSQSGMHDIDQRTRVMFYTQLQQNSINCWNTDKPLLPSNTAVLIKNDATLIHPVDIKADNWGHIWYLSNKTPLIRNPSVLVTTDLNFFVYKRTVRAIIENTVCDSEWFRSETEIDHSNDWEYKEYNEYDYKTTDETTEIPETTETKFT